jgi:hypothetical protein
LGLLSRRVPQCDPQETTVPSQRQTERMKPELIVQAERSRFRVLESSCCLAAKRLDYANGGPTIHASLRNRATADPLYKGDPRPTCTRESDDVNKSDFFNQVNRKCLERWSDGKGWVVVNRWGLLQRARAAQPLPKELRSARLSSKGCTASNAAASSPDNVLLETSGIVLAIMSLCYATAGVCPQRDVPPLRGLAGLRQIAPLFAFFERYRQTPNL